MYNSDSRHKNYPVLALSSVLCNKVPTQLPEFPNKKQIPLTSQFPSKSTLHNMARESSGKIDEIMELLLAQAGNDAQGTIMGDPSGFSIMKYVDREDAKAGKVSRPGFDKLHVPVAPHGMISACEVTDGRRHDSPVFRSMYKTIPDGSGDVLLDAACLARESCTIIADSGRRPVICPKPNSVPRGV